MKSSYSYLLIFILNLFYFCGPELGDSCSTNGDCGTSEDQICDLTQPGGYCLKIGCLPDSCGEEGNCVVVTEGEEKTYYCLKGCNRDADCRKEYFCFIPKSASDPIQIIDYEPNYDGVCIPK